MQPLEGWQAHLTPKGRPAATINSKAAEFTPTGVELDNQDIQQLVYSRMLRKLLSNRTYVYRQLAQIC